MSKSPKAMAEAIVRNLPEKTGKSLEEWVALAVTSGLATAKERAAWLKKNHGLGHFQAQIVAEEASGRSWRDKYQ